MPPRTSYAVTKRYSKVCSSGFLWFCTKFSRFERFSCLNQLEEVFHTSHVKEHAQMKWHWCWQAWKNVLYSNTFECVLLADRSSNLTTSKILTSSNTTNLFKPLIWLPLFVHSFSALTSVCQSWDQTNIPSAKWRYSEPSPQTEEVSTHPEAKWEAQTWATPGEARGAVCSCSCKPWRWATGQCCPAQAVMVVLWVAEEAVAGGSTSIGRIFPRGWIMSLLLLSKAGLTRGGCALFPCFVVDLVCVYKRISNALQNVSFGYCVNKLWIFEGLWTLSAFSWGFECMDAWGFFMLMLIVIVLPVCEQRGSCWE